MIVYLDASALVKEYTEEVGSTEVDQLLVRAGVLGTSLLSRAEVASALAKAVRTRALSWELARTALQTFRANWPRLVRLGITEDLVIHADSLTWEYGLRGFDAVHLAAALSWQQSTQTQITFATFDRHLWQAAQAAGLAVWPDDLGPFAGAQAPPVT
jgi:predicted nucleic acid-binding protein